MCATSSQNPLRMAYYSMADDLRPAARAGRLPGILIHHLPGVPFHVVTAHRGSLEFVTLN